MIAELFPGIKAESAVDTLTSTFLTEQDGFSNRATLQQLPENHVTALIQEVRKLTELGIPLLAAPYPCLGKVNGADDEACVSSVVESFARKAFRGPLAQEESTSLLGFYRAEKAARGGKQALEQVLAAVLLAPRFLFRTELGAGDAKGAFKLTPHETAALLAAIVTDGGPDAELAAAANAGQLQTRDQLAAQVKRLVTKPGAPRGVVRFFGEQFGVYEVHEVNKDPAVFKTFDDKLLGQMAGESERFIEEVLVRGDGKVSTLLTSNVSFVTKGLAALYGTGSSESTGETDFRKMTLPEAQRGGLLTQGAFLAHVAHPDATDVVRRGKFVREQLLCQKLPPPPMDADVNPIPVSSTKQQRELLSAHVSKPECAGCHAPMDPIGFTFENYDAVGAWRTTEAGRAINPTGTIENIDGKSVQVANALELMRTLAASAEVRKCLAAELFEYAHGRPASAADACALTAVQQAFESSGGNVTDALTALVTHESFTTRTR